MKLSSHQVKTAQYLGETKAIEDAEDRDHARRMRELRAENIRRAAAAS